MDDPVPTMDQTFGAMFIGVLFATLFVLIQCLCEEPTILYSFQGILTLQSYIFFEAFPQDLLRVKFLVASVWLLDATHLVLIAQSAYHYLVTKWGVQEALGVATAPLDLHLIFIGAPTLLCQAIWMFSGHNLLLATILGAACLAAFGLEVAISAQIIQVPSVAYFSVLKGEVIALFTLGAAVDVAIAFVLLFYLHQGKMKNHFESTNWVLGRVMEYTVATGLATSLLAVACLIAYLILPHTFIFIAMHFSLGRLYTNALLATLNSRRRLRAIAQSGQRAVPSFTVMTSRVVTTQVDDAISDDGYAHALKDLPPSPKSLTAASTPLRGMSPRALTRPRAGSVPCTPLSSPGFAGVGVVQDRF
ncbi:ANK-REP-REGION domain-containing protein [Mycena kentingensis (nom. inval.)]|nr:ANK-REP-REGION domain-containing protein [Mycena kentingensis (nom. inval.)]